MKTLTATEKATKHLEQAQRLLSDEIKVLVAKDNTEGIRLLIRAQGHIEWALTALKGGGD